LYRGVRNILGITSMLCWGFLVKKKNQPEDCSSHHN
jgi:hypothetical protein